MCPRCRGLFVLGDEYSIRNRFFCGFVSFLVEIKKLERNWFVKVMFKKPWIKLCFSTIYSSDFKNSIISSEISMGFLFNRGINGNNTTV